MTSKSELKRMATVDPLGTAERLAELEQGVRSWERQAGINMDNYLESKTEVNRLIQVIGNKNARIVELRPLLAEALEWITEAADFSLTPDANAKLDQFILAARAALGEK